MTSLSPEAAPGGGFKVGLWTSSLLPDLLAVGEGKNRETGRAMQRNEHIDSPPTTLRVDSHTVRWEVSPPTAWTRKRGTRWQRGTLLNAPADDWLSHFTRPIWKIELWKNIECFIPPDRPWLLRNNCWSCWGVDWGGSCSLRHRETEGTSFFLSSPIPLRHMWLAWSCSSLPLVQGGAGSGPGSSRFWPSSPFLETQSRYVHSQHSRALSTPQHAYAEQQSWGCWTDPETGLPS